MRKRLTLRFDVSPTLLSRPSRRRLTADCEEVGERCIGYYTYLDSFFMDNRNLHPPPTANIVDDHQLSPTTRTPKQPANIGAFQ